MRFDTKGSDTEVTKYDNDSSVFVTIYGVIRVGRNIESAIKKAEKLSGKGVALDSVLGSDGDYRFRIKSVGHVLVNSELNDEPVVLATRKAKKQILLFLKNITKEYLRLIAQQADDMDVYTNTCIDIPKSVYKALLEDLDNKDFQKLEIGNLNERLVNEFKETYVKVQKLYDLIYNNNGHKLFSENEQDNSID